MPGRTADAGGRSFQVLALPEAEMLLYPAFFSQPVRPTVSSGS